MKVYNEDCLVGMPNRIADKSIDCIVCDLPYFKIVDDDFDNQWAAEHEYLEWVRAIIEEYERIIKDDGNLFLFSSRQMNTKICTILDEYFYEQRVIIWARKRGFNNTRGRALASGYEPIAFYTKNPKCTKFNSIKIHPKTNRKEYVSGILKDGVTLSDVWTDIPALPHNSKEKTTHPTQKPLALMERIIEIGSNPGDLILDNCMGSGTTGVAAQNLGRDFIGFEKDPQFFNIAKSRLGL